MGGAIVIFDRAGRALRGDFVTIQGFFNPLILKNQKYRLSVL